MWGGQGEGAAAVVSPNPNPTLTPPIPNPYPVATRSKTDMHSAEMVARAIKDLLVCMEMFVAAIAYQVSVRFSPKATSEWKHSRTRGCSLGQGHFRSTRALAA